MSTKAKFTIKLVSAAAVLAFSAGGWAGTVTFDPITAMWINGDPAANVLTYQQGTANPLARWGGNSGANPSPDDSGYDFQAAATPLNVVVPPNTFSPLFDLGTFTHHNNPIPAGTSITGIDLFLNTGVYIDGVGQGNKQFLFHFIHDETPNGADPCADGGAYGVGVNVNGCADHVKTQWVASSDTFEIANDQGGFDTYTLNIMGFQTPDGKAVDFWTKEAFQNVATLKARIVLASDTGGGGIDDPPLPEPGSLPLMGIGLAAFAASRFRSLRFKSAAGG